MNDQPIMNQPVGFHDRLGYEQPVEWIVVMIVQCLESQGVLDLHRVEREPFLQRGVEQKIMDTTKVEGQDRRCHIVPFQY